MMKPFDAAYGELPLHRKDNNSTVHLLIQSAIAGHADVVETLLRDGAPINSGDKEGATALQWAARLRHTEVVKLLLDGGADPDAQDQRGYTALYWAARNGSTEIVKLLLDKGAKPAAHGPFTATELHWAAHGDHDEVVKLFLDNGVHLDARAAGDFTPLHYAVIGGAIKAVKVLLDHGADPHLLNSDGNTALQLATRYDNAEIAQMLEGAPSRPVESRRPERSRLSAIWAALSS